MPTVSTLFPEACSFLKMEQDLNNYSKRHFLILLLMMLSQCLTLLVPLYK